MWIEYIIIACLAYFVSSHLAKMCAFRVVQPGDRPIFIIFAIQIFTVIWQVAIASVLGVYHGYGFTRNFIPDYLTTYCRNFKKKMKQLLKERCNWYSYMSYWTVFCKQVERRTRKRIFFLYLRIFIHKLVYKGQNGSKKVL